MKYLTAFVFLAMLAAPATVAHAEDANVAGSYRVDGTNFDGSAYRGTAEIVMTGKNTCHIHWKIGRDDFNGFCLVRGRIFTSGYRGGNSVGLVSYGIKEDGAISGIWAIDGKTGTGTETLTPAR